MKALKLLIALAVITSLLVGTAGTVAAQDGGDAVAIQSSEQSNSNTQVGIASAENSAEQEQSQEIEIDLGDGGRNPDIGGGR